MASDDILDQASAAIKETERELAELLEQEAGNRDAFLQGQPSLGELAYGTADDFGAAANNNNPHHRLEPGVADSTPFHAPRAGGGGSGVGQQQYSGGAEAGEGGGSGRGGRRLAGGAGGDGGRGRPQPMRAGTGRGGGALPRGSTLLDGRRAEAPRGSPIRSGGRGRGAGRGGEGGRGGESVSPPRTIPEVGGGGLGRRGAGPGGPASSRGVGHQGMQGGSLGVAGGAGAGSGGGGSRSNANNADPMGSMSDDSMIVAGGGAPGGGGGGGGSGASSAAAVASSSSESEDPTGTSSSSSASSSSSSSSFAQFAPLVDLEHSVADGTVLDLKHRLRTTERSHGLLQRQYEALQRKYHTEAAQAEEKCLRYCKQIDNLTAALEQLIEKNVDLGAEVAHERAEGGLARDRVADLEESLGTMRQLMMEYLSKPTAAAKRSAAEKEFWKKLATPEVLAQSRPPRSFPVRKAHPVHTMELTRVRGQLTLQQSENKRLRSKLAELMKANADLRSRHLESRKEAKQLVSEQSHQLVGAVRRIRYLLDKHKDLTSTADRREAYTRRIEAKLLRQTAELRSARARARAAITDRFDPGQENCRPPPPMGGVGGGGDGGGALSGSGGGGTGGGGGGGGGAFAGGRASLAPPLPRPGGGNNSSRAFERSLRAPPQQHQQADASSYRVPRQVPRWGPQHDRGDGGADDDYDEEGMGRVQSSGSAAVQHLRDAKRHMKGGAAVDQKWQAWHRERHGPGGPLDSHGDDDQDDHDGDDGDGGRAGADIGGGQQGAGQQGAGQQGAGRPPLAARTPPRSPISDRGSAAAARQAAAERRARSPGSPQQPAAKRPPLAAVSQRPRVSGRRKSWRDVNIRPPSSRSGGSSGSNKGSDEGELTSAAAAAAAAAAEAAAGGAAGSAKRTPGSSAVSSAVTSPEEPDSIDEALRIKSPSTHSGAGSVEQNEFAAGGDGVVGAGGSAPPSEGRRSERSKRSAAERSRLDAMIDEEYGERTAEIEGFASDLQASISSFYK